MRGRHNVRGLTIVAAILCSSHLLILEYLRMGVAAHDCNMSVEVVPLPSHIDVAFTFSLAKD